MANRKITELTALTAPAADDVLPIIDVSEGVNANKNKKITYGELFKSVVDGTASAPSIAFDSSATTGLYRSAANEISIATGGTQRVVFDSTGNTTVKGDLVVQGTTTTVSSTTITVADKNLELATGNSSDAGCDGGGLTLKGATDKTWNWVDSTDAWTSNQNLDLVATKSYRIANALIASTTTLGPTVVNSSLTSVGTLGALTVTNAVTAGSLDISGNADIDGTMEADAYTVDGTALNEYIADTVGAMVSGNTETNITVTYEDSDNTLDFVIGTLNQNTTGTAGGLSGTPNITVGDVVAASLDISGNADIDGTLETDALTIDGTALNEYIADTVGAMVSGNTETNIAVTYDDSDNTLDFTISSYPAASISGTTLASNVVSSSLTSVGTLGSLSVTNAVVAGSLDISGGADIDGTLEADAYTVDGVALNEYIADTVGAMVSSNTETDITVTYDDSDNTLDFVVGNIAGNAGTATALQTARTIGGVSFNGTANINLPGVNQTGNQNTTGSAATLTTARTIGGVSFDGSANINLPGVNAAGNQNTSGTAAGLSGTPNITVADVVAASLDISGNADIDGTLEADAYTVNGTALNEYIADTVGAMVSSNTETNITVTYEDSDNTLDFVIGTLNQDTTGNAATATALQTARTIGGVSFDGTANITLPGVNATGNQNTTGSAATLTTARTIGGVSFDGSANINLPGVNTAGNQDTSGNAATATKLATARAINGVNFDGTAAITITAAAGTLTGATLASGVTASSLTSVGTLSSLTTSGNVIVGGNLTVNGTQTIVNSTTITVDDKNLELGSVASPSDTTANGGGITLKGATDKTFNWVSSSAAWTSSEHLDLASGKVLKVAGTQILSNSQYTGNAATATALATARTIGGVSFDGTANINLPGVNAAGNQNTSGTAANLSGTPNITVGDVVAASLDISGNVDVDGTLETDALTINGTSLSETIADTVGAMVTSNTETGITVTYDDADNTLDFVIGTLNQNTTGNAATATALQNARTIGGVSFDGTANINLPGVNTAGNQDTSGNAATATKLATARAINGVNFDGTAAITVAAAAGTLTGNTLASGVTASSLTSVGTLTGLTVSGNISMTGTGAIDVPTGTTAQRPGSPTTGLFRYNSTEGEFEGYTASGWGAIAGGGGSGGTDFKYLALRNAANNGAASYPASDFTLVTSGTSNAISPTQANALLVSYGGVLQQPNAGTSTPSTGFAVSGSTIKFGSNIAAAPDFIIYLMNAGVGAPSDNTVTSAKIVDGSIVNADVNASAAIALSKLATGLLPSGITINADNIVDGTVVAADIAANAITASELADNAVDTNAILNNAVTGAKIAMGSDAAGDILYYNGTDYVRLPVGTAGQSLKVNSGASAPEWGTAAAGAKGGGNENIFWENETTMNNSYTISTNYNAGVFGPLTVASGATITVPSGSVLSIV